jgi:hypothetical protein
MTNRQTSGSRAGRQKWIVEKKSRQQDTRKNLPPRYGAVPANCACNAHFE